MSPAYERLIRFLDAQMQMSHIYQPLMLRVLLTHGGRAPIRAVAAAILAHDESQIDYYAEIVKRMPGRVLRQRGVVIREGDEYALADDLRDLSNAEREDLITRCREKVERFTERRGTAIWEHRRPATGIIPGSVRYNTFKRAAGRCELCGVPHEERALDVDHIAPRSEGGTDHPDNLQALCWRCNQDKGAGDATDFRGIRESYAKRELGCPFCELSDRQLIAENPLALLILDGFPVTEGHMLAIPRRHVADYFDLHPPERNAIQRLLEDGCAVLRVRHPEIAGFNIGINVGEAAGQTILHCHVHLIPRRVGDVERPRGGVRGGGTNEARLRSRELTKSPCLPISEAFTEQLF